jgi:hypothetical protein
MSERELCWRAAGKRGGKMWLWFEEEVFNLKPAAYQYGQEQEHKKDRQRERNLVKTMTWIHCNGDRQHEYKSNSGYDHHRPGESTHPTLLLRHAHCRRFYNTILNYCQQSLWSDRRRCADRGLGCEFVRMHSSEPQAEGSRVRVARNPPRTRKVLCPHCSVNELVIYARPNDYW